jgi:2-phosphosulfolactate phosphatase
MESRLLEVLFTPSDYEALRPARLTEAVCVVFDILRATSSMVTALSHGARDIRPARQVADAVRLKQLQPDCLLAGERDGLRIRADATGGIEFDLGNSPREFTRPVVEGKSIVMTTTNGTRAWQACRGAHTTLIASFLNLRATADYVLELRRPFVLICSGTGERVAYEDVLGAGALVGLISRALSAMPLADSALMAQRLYESEERDLGRALAGSANGRRLTGLPELQGDVAFCAQRDCFPIAAGARGDDPIAVIQR